MNIQIFDHTPHNFKSELEFAGLYLLHDDRVLLMQKSADRQASGLWGIPGGKLFKGENPAKGLLREIEEETGLVLIEEDIHYDEKLYVVSETSQFIFHTFKMTFEKLPLIVMSEEHQDYGWYTYDEAEKMPLYPGALICYKRIL